VPTSVKTHKRYASIDGMIPESILNLIYNEQLGGVFDIIRKAGIMTWESMEYLPVPLPEEEPARDGGSKDQGVVTKGNSAYAWLSQ